MNIIYLIKAFLRPLSGKNIKYNPRYLAAIDSVEIVNLKWLRVGAYQHMKGTEKAQFVRLSGESAQEIAKLWRELPSKGEMRCHIPPFGVRFYSNDSLELQASICWECNNIYGEVRGKLFSYEFNAKHSVSQKLLSICQQVFE